MTPLPKRRISTARSSKRKRAITLSFLSLIKCKNCNHAIKPHTVCPNCGFYGAKKVLAIKNKTDKHPSHEKSV